MNKLRRFPQIVAEIIAATPDDLLRKRPPTGEFAVAEQPSHLADLEEEGFGVRIERLLTEEHPALSSFDGEKVAAERNYIERDPFAAAARFIAAREKNLRRIGDLSSADWNRTGSLENVGEVTLRRVVEMMGEHDAAHARELQINGVRSEVLSEWIT